MKYIIRKILFSLLLFNSVILSQSNKVIRKSVDSIFLRGTIQGSPFVMYLKKGEMIDCDSNNTYIEGWYYYEKYRVKIPLNGISMSCLVKVYNYAKDFPESEKIFEDYRLDPIYEDIYKNYFANKYREPYYQMIFENSKYNEAIDIPRCAPSDETKVKNLEGVFIKNKKKSKILFNINKIKFGKTYEFFILPNSKKIDLTEIFFNSEGNNFYSLKQDRNENRLILYYDTVPSYCGTCGMAEARGYRIIIFNKNWKIKSTEEYPIESCFLSIYDTKILKKTGSIIKYLIQSKDTEFKTKHILIIDKKNARIIEKNIKNAT